jgi:hypothetical protein
VLLDLWAYRRASVSPPAGGQGGGQTKQAKHAALQSDDTMRRAMLESRIRDEDEELMVLVAAFVRTLQ